MTGTGTHLPLSPSALKGRGGTQAAARGVIGEAGLTAGPSTARRAEGA